MTKQKISYSFLIFLLTFLNSGLLMAQAVGNINELPFQYLSSYQVPVLINSSFSGGQSLKEVGVGYSSRAGLFSSVRTTSFHCILNLNRADTLKRFKHDMGLIAISMHDGDVFSKSRITIFYTPRVPLSTGFLSTSFKCGLASYAFQSTDFSPGGADTKPIYDLSLSYQSRQQWIGFGFHEITNAVLRPVSDRYILNRFFSVFYQGKWDISAIYCLQAGVLSYYFSEASKICMQPDIHIRYKELLSGGVFYNSYNKSVGVQLALDDFRMGLSNIQIYGTYRSPIYVLSGSRFNYFELLVRYKFRSFRRNGVVIK